MQKKTTSYKGRLTRAFILNSALPLSALLVIAFLVFHNIQVQQAQSSMDTIITQEHSRLEAIMAQVSGVSSVLHDYISSNLAYGNAGEKSYQSLLNLEQLRTNIKAMQFQHNIQLIRVYSDMLPFISRDAINFFSLDDLEALGLPQGIVEERVPFDQLRYETMTIGNSAYTTGVLEVVSFYRIIRNIQGEVMAVFFIDYKLDDIFPRNATFSPDIECTVLDTALGLAYSDSGRVKSAELFDTVSEGLENQGRSSIYVQRKLDAVPWTLAMRATTKNLIYPGIALIPAYVLLFSLTLVVCILSGVTYSRYISKRMMALFAHINAIQDSDFISYNRISAQLDLLCSHKGMEQEVKVMIRQFSSLLKRNIALKDEMSRREVDIANYKFAVLQAQINPHFLYNILDTLHTCIFLKQNDMAGKLIAELSSFYRLCLSKGKDIITIEEEASMINHYLELERIAYQDEVGWGISLDEEVKCCEIPKFTLQPIVENSIVHGKKDRRIFISVRAFRCNDTAVIQIEDNGCGFVGDVLSGHEAHDPGGMLQVNRGFGLGSINNRIRLLYGEGYGLKIGNTGHGVKTQIILPIGDD